MCISGGKKVWILQKYLKFAVNVLKGAAKVELSAIKVNDQIEPPWIKWIYVLFRG